MLNLHESSIRIHLVASLWKNALGTENKVYKSLLYLLPAVCFVSYFVS